MKNSLDFGAQDNFIVSSADNDKSSQRDIVFFITICVFSLVRKDVSICRNSTSLLHRRPDY